jgi:hypothetical protein
MTGNASALRRPTGAIPMVDLPINPVVDESRTQTSVSETQRG